MDNRTRASANLFDAPWWVVAVMAFVVTTLAVVQTSSIVTPQMTVATHVNWTFVNPDKLCLQIYNPALWVTHCYSGYTLEQATLVGPYASVNLVASVVTLGSQLHTGPPTQMDYSGSQAFTFVLWICAAVLWGGLCVVGVHWMRGPRYIDDTMRDVSHQIAMQAKEASRGKLTFERPTPNIINSAWIAELKARHADLYLRFDCQAEPIKVEWTTRSTNCL